MLGKGSISSEHISTQNVAFEIPIHQQIWRGEIKITCKIVMLISASLQPVAGCGSVKRFERF